MAEQHKRMKAFRLLYWKATVGRFCISSAGWVALNTEIAVRMELYTCGAYNWIRHLVNYFFIYVYWYNISKAGSASKYEFNDEFKILLPFVIRIVHKNLILPFFMSLICFCAVLMIMHQLFSRFFYSLFFAFLRERERERKRKRGQFLKGTGIQRNPGVAVFISLFSCYSCISLSVPSSSKNKNLT